MVNATALKILLGIGIAVFFVLAFNLAKAHYISVGEKKERARVEVVYLKEQERLQGIKADALADAANRLQSIHDKETTLGGALNSSEVLNHEDIDSPCLSDSRRLRIDAVR